MLGPGTKEAGVEADRPVAGSGAHQEIFSLMCLPCAYGWPMSRPLKKDLKYTGLVSVSSTGEHEVTVEVFPAEAKVKLTLEIDGEPIDQAVKTNESVTVLLQRGVRALSISTGEDVSQGLPYIIIGFRFSGDLWRDG